MAIQKNPQRGGGQSSGKHTPGSGGGSSGSGGDSYSGGQSGPGKGGGSSGVNTGSNAGYGGGGAVSQSQDWQALINEAVKKGDFASAAVYEQLRNQKISDPGYQGSQTTTDLYPGYLPQNQKPQFELPNFNDYLSQTGFDQYSAQTQAAIQAAVDKAVGGYQSQMDQTARDSDEMARQAYIAKMLGGKNLEQQLSDAGYAGGLADSQKIQLETAYQNNLQSIETQKQSVMAELKRAIEAARLSGDMQAAQELSAYLQAIQGQWAGYVQSQQQMQNSNYWNQQQMNQQSRETAYTRAMNLLASGVMPGRDVLAAAGISELEAAGIRNYYQQQATPQTATVSTAKTRSVGGGGGGNGGGGYDNAGLSTSQVAQLQSFLGVTADGLWGAASSNAAGGMDAQEAWNQYQRVSAIQTREDAIGLMNGMGSSGQGVMTQTEFIRHKNSGNSIYKNYTDYLDYLRNYLFNQMM